MQISRIIEIIYILIDKKRVTAAELAEKFEVSVRTVYRDIDTLSQAGFPVYAERGRSGGIRIMDGFCLDKTLLTASDKSQLMDAVSGFAAMGAADGGAVQRLKSFFGIKDSFDWLMIDLSDWEGVTQDLYNLIKCCISEKRSLSFDYYSSKGEMSHRNAFPVQLIFKSRAWYLSAYCLDKREMRLFKLRRMKRVRAGEKYDGAIPRANYDDPGKYSESTEVILKISEKMTYRIYDDFDEENISRAEDGSFIVKCRYPVDDWVYGMILSYADGCEVLSPVFIRDGITARLLKTLENYKKT